MNQRAVSQRVDLFIKGSGKKLHGKGRLMQFDSRGPTKLSISHGVPDGACNITGH